MAETLFIIDSFSLIFQVYHGISAMTGPEGQPTNAIFGFTRDIKNLLRDQQPDYLICALDSPEPGHRKEIYPQYKAHRTEMPPDLKPQIPHIVEVISGFNIPIVQCPGWEADDVIATLTHQAVNKNLNVRIVTTDKDARQLLNSQVQLYNLRKNVFLDESGLMDAWGIRPDQAIDFQALVGDSSDNIPGVPLVGPKKAATLLNEIGTFEEILAQPEKARGKKLQENLKTYADQARISRELVTLKTDLPLSLELEQARVSQPDHAQLKKLFTQHGFRRFAQEVDDAADAGAQRQDEFSQQAKWEIVDTPKKFDSFMQQLQEQSQFCLDLETTSLQATQAEIVGWAICWEPTTAWYIPVDAPPGQKTLQAEEVCKALRPLLENPQIGISNQNIKYDMLVLLRAGIQLQGVAVDPMVGDYLLDAGARSHSLDTLAEKYLQHKMIPISELIGTGSRQKKMFEVDVDKAAEYAAEDANIAWKLSTVIKDELQASGLWDLYWNMERPLIPVLVAMESRGICVDEQELNSQSQQINQRLEELVAEIYEIAGHEFNIASPKQLRTVLFEELSLPVQKKTKTGPSTDVEVLEKLAGMHPLPEKIMEHRHLSKLKGTYLDALVNLINPHTGRIHCSFNQVVAATGRLSSSDPNLQNIPIRTEEGRRVRKAFIPGEAGWNLVCADYSQVELRMLAHLSGDEALSEAFHRGDDIHTAVAAQVFGVTAEEVDSQMRRVAKAVNFGVIYGQSPYGLSASLKISLEEATRFIDDYFQLYAGVAQFMQQTLEQCKQLGYASTISGRRRAISGIRGGFQHQLIMPERTAVNTVVQGSAADLIKKAMINLHERMKNEQVQGRLLLQIHDELVLEAPNDEVEHLSQIVKEEMEQAMSLNVPLVVDLSVAENWFAAK